MDGQAQLQRHGCGLSGNQEGQVGTQRHLAQGHTGKTFTKLPQYALLLGESPGIPVAAHTGRESIEE